MTAVSDVFNGKAGGGMPSGGPTIVVERPGASGPADAHVRARVAGTQRDGKVLRWARTGLALLAGAWVWREVPPSLRQVVAARVPDRTLVPGGHLGMWLFWLAYNHAVAIPATAVGYFAVWLAQHPARLALTVALVAVPILVLVNG